MEYIIPLFVFLLSNDIEPEKYEYRFDENSAARVKSYFPMVDHVSTKTETPSRVLLGIIYTESNAHPHVKGDNGSSYGLGQVRCRVWFDWLRDNGMNRLRHCGQLLRPYTNLLAVGKVASYLKDRNDATWTEAVEMYNSGTTVSEIDSIERRKKVKEYRRRVQYFGGLFQPRFEYYRENVKPVFRKMWEFQTLRFKLSRLGSITKWKEGESGSPLLVYAHDSTQRHRRFRPHRN